MNEYCGTLSQPLPRGRGGGIINVTLQTEGS
jgi:hypothetical protein